MISKIFNRVASKTFANKTKAHVFQPKSINVYFPNSVNPEFKIINLTGLAAVNFSIKEDSEKSLFILSANMNSHNHVQDMVLGSFKSKEDAENALNEIRVALYVPSKSFAKWLSLIAVIGALTCMAFVHVNSSLMGTGLGISLKSSTDKGDATQKGTNTSRVTPSENSQNANPRLSEGIIVPPMPMNIDPKDIPPPVSDGEIDNIINQLQQVKQLQETMKQKQMGQQQVMQQPESHQQVEQPVSPAEQFLKGLN